MTESPPKAFISYSWTTPEHENWVISLATKLVESGIDVKLDKWDLRVGDDTFSFMESMVNDAEISKVIIISDKKYTEKANGREGGVGTETQIITPKIYAESKQDKFAMIITEKDENKKAYVPTFYSGRVYIDFSNEDKFSKSFEELLRWILDKPLHIKPEIGQIPSFLETNTAISLGTSIAKDRALDRLRHDPHQATSHIGEFLDIFTSNANRLIGNEDVEEIYDILTSSIDIRDDYLEVVNRIIKYACSDDNITLIHKFFEKLTRLSDRVSRSDISKDVVRFLTQEMFIHTTAIFLDAGKFRELNTFLNMKYYIKDYGGQGLYGYQAIRSPDIKSLEIRSRNNGQSRVSPRADELENRSKTGLITKENMHQADFVLYVRSVVSNESESRPWFPDTLIFEANRYEPYEIFVRAESSEYYNNLSSLFAGISKDDFLVSLSEKRPLQWGHYQLESKYLVNFEKLCTLG